MGKEADLLNQLLNDPQLPEFKGNPEKVLQKIDHFTTHVERLMVIGPNKGQYIINKMAQSKPKIMIELGCYVGYSAILFGKELAKVGGKYHSFEISEEYAGIAKQIIDIAGLSSTVNITIGPAQKTLPTFAKSYGKPLDFIFIDHAKELYVPDLKILESTGLVGKGTVMVGDNIISPGAPEYHKYVNLTPEEKKVLITNTEFPGKWDNVYKSELIKIGHDGIEVSDCVECP